MTETKKILIVDDEEPIAAYLARKLQKLGHVVRVASDGQEAIDAAFADCPDLVLLDVKLPRKSGLEVAAALRADARTRRVAIIMLSAKAQQSEIDQGLKAGADRYLCKPLGFPDILHEISQFK